jgi:hypothetical protein
VIRICYCEDDDRDFIRWTSNLLRTFLADGTLGIVSRDAAPDLMLASVWRRQRFPAGVAVILISNENWQVFPPRAPLRKYAAVLGLYPPPEPCTFVAYPYAAVHFDVPVEELYARRARLLELPKSRFCCMVVSNTRGEQSQRRLALFDELNRWRPVDSGGKILNNLGYRPPRGLEFLEWIAQYRYMICLENSRAPDYLTEKPFQPWFAGTVPIYDGAIGRLNPQAIVAADSDVLAQLQQLEASPQAYELKRRAPLIEPPLSLADFEARFRALLPQIMAQRALNGAARRRGWLGSWFRRS